MNEDEWQVRFDSDEEWVKAEWVKGLFGKYAAPSITDGSKLTIMPSTDGMSVTLTTSLPKPPKFATTEEADAWMEAQL